jgi:AcrR family transcriptional regulator
MTPRSDKDGREPLTREKIVEKAIDLIDAEGVEGLSMRHLGEALGVEAMALYHHFPSKEAILDGVVEHIVAETGPAVVMAGGDWKLHMMEGPAAAGRALEVHPRAGWLFLGRQYTTATSLRMLEVPLAILHSAGFRGAELVDAAHAIFAYAAGWYVLTAGDGGTWSGPADEAIAAATKADTDATPLATSMAPELRDWSRGFDAGLAALMDGLDSRRGR